MLTTIITFRLNIGFPAHFRHLCIQFHQFSIQFHPKKLTAFKSKVQFRQTVHSHSFYVNQIKNFSIQILQLSLKFFCVARRVRNVGSNSSFLRTNSVLCHSNSSSVIGPLHLGIEILTKMNANRRNWFCSLVLSYCDHGRTTNGHSTPPLLWSNDSHRHLIMCILMRTFRWWTMSII